MVFTYTYPLFDALFPSPSLTIPTDTFVLTGSQQITTTPPPWNRPTTFDVAWEFVPTEWTLPDPCEAPNASVIGCENQSLGETVDIVGTPFALHYQSDRVGGRFLATPAAVAHAKELGGWTLSHHHRYDPVTNAIYLGSGDKRDAAALGTVKQNPAGGYLIGSKGDDEVYVFDAQGRHKETRHALTGATLYRFGYDAQRRLARITDGDGNITIIRRDASGRPSAVVAPFGQRTRLTVDANGYLATIANPAGEVVTLSTTPSGLLTGFTSPRGKSSIFSYDDDGLLIRDENAAGAAQVLERTDAGLNFAVKRTTGEKRAHHYDVTLAPAGGESRVITNPAGLKMTRSRDGNGGSSTTFADGEKSAQNQGADPRFGRSAGFLKSASLSTPGGLSWESSTTRKAVLADNTDPFSLTQQTDTVLLNGRRYISVYDAASRVVTETSPEKRKTRTSLDAQGRIVNDAVSGLFPAAYTYDAHGRLATLTRGKDANTRTLQLTYDAGGFLETLTDPLARIVRFARDAAGRVTQQTRPDGQVIDYTYDANGNLRTLTPPGRPSHRFGYDNVDLLSVYIAPKIGTEPNQTRYTYNLDRQLTQISRPDGKKIAFGYDSAGRVASLTFNRGTVLYGYDAATGGLNTLNAPQGIDVTYAYDGSLVTQTAWAGPIAGSVQVVYDNDLRVIERKVNGADSVTYAYDADGLLIRAGDMTLARKPQNGLLTGTTLGQISDEITYNGFAEAIDYQAAYLGNPLYAVHSAYDRLGRIKKKTETIGGESHTYAYVYGQSGRLFKVLKDGALFSKYAYDANGNRLSVTRAAAKITGAYDAQDRLKRYGAATYAYTAAGDLKSKTVGAKTTQYRYDALGNLAGVTLPDGTKIAYLIDGGNRRIGKKVNGKLVQGFLYQDQLRPLVELDAAGQIVSRFVYATHRNVPDYFIRGGVKYRIVTDHLGSPRIIIDVATGTVMQVMDYDEFGRIVIDTKPGFQPFGFAGGLFDQHTKLVRFGTRDYEPETGRWTAKDSIRFAGGDTNLFAYVLNDTINSTDVSGQLVGPYPPPVVASPAVLPVVIAGGVGYGIGTIINHYIEDWIQKQLTPLLPESDPESSKGLAPVNPGRDCNEKCKPCPPGQTWSHPGDAHGSKSGVHYHGIVWNQNPQTCLCFPRRVSGPTPDNLR